MHNINNGELNSLILNIINGTKDDFIIQDNNITFQITSLYNQNNINYNTWYSKYIDKECVNLLQRKFNIDMNETLFLFKYDYYIPGLKIPLIGFEIYNPITKEPLNIPVKINEDEIYKYNSNSDFYKDICYPYENEKGQYMIEKMNIIIIICLYAQKIVYSMNMIL